jgi:hypothetical protein
VAEIDPPQRPAGSRPPVQARQGFDELTAQEQIQPVDLQVPLHLVAAVEGGGDLVHQLPDGSDWTA